MTSTNSWKSFYEQGRHRLKGLYNRVVLTSVQRFFFGKICDSVQYYLDKGVNNVSLLSLGAGIDFVGWKIKNKYRDRVTVKLVDISQDCINFNKSLFKNKFRYECEDVLNYHSSEKHHIIYNTGLLEHFSDREKTRILGIVQANLFEGGKYLTLNPSETGRIYRSQMKRAKEKGTWPFGYEEPISSLASFSKDDIYVLEEVLCCSIFQIRFCFLNHKISYLLLPIVLLDDIGFLSLLDPLFSNYVGYYGLFTVFEKR